MAPCRNCHCTCEEYKIPSSTALVSVLYEQTDHLLYIHYILQTFIVQNNPNTENSILKTAYFPG